jgi:hypothetical protein
MNLENVTRIVNHENVDASSRNHIMTFQKKIKLEVCVCVALYTVMKNVIFVVNH